MDNTFYMENDFSIHVIPISQMVFLKTGAYGVNNKTKPFWVKVVHLVPNVQILAGHSDDTIHFENFEI